MNHVSKHMLKGKTVGTASVDELSGDYEIDVMGISAEVSECL